MLPIFEDLNHTLGGESFGRTWYHSVGTAPELSFCVEEFLELLRDYDPEPQRLAHLTRMKQFVLEGSLLELGTTSAPAEVSLRLWGASMVRRVAMNGSSALHTETIQDDVKIREFLSSANLRNADDLQLRGEHWTFVANQLQGSSSRLQDLQHELFSRTGLSGGVNGYLTPPASLGKPPHVDDHDVLVIQQFGEKLWSLMDVMTRKVVAEIHMKQGDVLYLPQGVLHCARALDDAPSLHIAVGLHRSTMSVASILAAVVTACNLGDALGDILTTAMVEEMDSRSVAFAAFGGREHWVNQLLPPALHEPLVRALDPVDAMTAGSGGQDLLTQLATVLQQRAADLLSLVRSGEVNVPGEPLGLARHRHLVQAAALADERTLSLLVAMSLTDVLPLATAGFWMRREGNVDRHFANFGPRHSPCAALDLQEVLDEALWCRAPLNVVALRRPGGSLRLNGVRTSGWSAEEVDAACFCLRVFGGAAGGPFALSDIPGPCTAGRRVLTALVRVGVVERHS